MMSDETTNPFPNPSANAYQPGADPRDAIRTMADAWGVSFADAARVFEGEANYSAERGVY